MVPETKAPDPTVKSTKNIENKGVEVAQREAQTLQKFGKEVLTESLFAIFQEPPKESAAITLVIKTL